MYPFYIHVAAMGAGVILLAAGIFAASFFRNTRWWLKFHRPAGITGVVCLTVGAAAAVVMVSLGGDGHLQVLHAWLGLAAILFAISAPVLGTLQFTLRSHTGQIRRWHRLTGYVALFLCIIPVFAGVKTVG